MKGLDVYKTKDGFTVARLHYTADPEKASDPLLVEGYPGGKTGAIWRKEMEIDFTAFSGQLLCYDIMTRHRAKIISNRKLEDYYRLYGSLDWGRNNPASFHIYWQEEGHIHSCFEIYRNDTSIPDFCSLIKNAPLYQRLIWISADPSMWSKNQETREGLRSLKDLFQDEDIVLRRGKSRDDSIAINELLDRWYQLEDNDARFTISPNCPMQIWEFERLRYEEITTTMIERKNYSERLVDKDNHSWDDFKYFISTLLAGPDKPEIEKPLPRYSVGRLLQGEKKSWKDNFV